MSSIIFPWSGLTTQRPAELTFRTARFTGGLSSNHPAGISGRQTRLLAAVCISLLAHFLGFTIKRAVEPVKPAPRPHNSHISLAVSMAGTSARQPHQSVTQQAHSEAVHNNKRHKHAPTKMRPPAHSKRRATSLPAVKPATDKPEPNKLTAPLHRNPTVQNARLKPTQSMPDGRETVAAEDQHNNPATMPVNNASKATRQKANHTSGNNAVGSQATLAGLPLLLNPKFLHPPRLPVYPQPAIRRGQQGSTWIRAKISKTGTVAELFVHRSSSYDLLDQAAIQAVKAWKFEPARHSGQPVAAWVQVPVHFKLTR